MQLHLTMEGGYLLTLDLADEIAKHVPDLGRLVTAATTLTFDHRKPAPKFGRVRMARVPDGKELRVWRMKG